tara:strand:+ start:1433 stop:1657 length:225 start_codon:yes stop_codon:yes gene_type:complete
LAITQKAQIFFIELFNFFIFVFYFLFFIEAPNAQLFLSQLLFTPFQRKHTMLYITFSIISFSLTTLFVGEVAFA